MSALASAFVRLRPDPDKREWTTAGEKSGRDFGDGVARGSDGKLRDAHGKIVADFAASGSKSGKGFAGAFSQAAAAGKLDRVGDVMAGVGVAGVAAFGFVTKAAADFDKQMSAVGAATNAGAGDMDALRKAALQAGKDTQFSATGAAQGITELSKAGVATADILGGGLKGALNLAAVGQLDVGEAAETAASAMTQFKLSGKDIPHIADLLASGAGHAQGSVHDLGMALNQAGLVASQTGLSIEDTTGTLAAFANAGLIGSDAGTSFKTMLLAIQNPAGKTKDMMDELGISAYDAQGQFVGITKFAGILQDRLKNLTPQVRAQALAQIFGNDAVRAGSILYEQGAAGLEAWIRKSNEAGYAVAGAAKLTDNLAGDVERLKGSLETLAIESGSGANTGLRILAKSLDVLIGQFSAMPSGVAATLTVLVGIGGAVALALAAFIKLRKGLAEAVTQLSAMGPAGEKAATGLQKVAGAAGKATLAFAALEVGTAVFNKLGAANVNVDKLSTSVENLARTGNVAGELSTQFGANMEKLGVNASLANSKFFGFVDDVEGSIPIFGDAAKSMVNFGGRLATGTDFQTAKDRMVGLDQAMTNFMTTTNNAKQSSELWNRVQQQSGLDTAQLAEVLPNAYKKVGELNVAADKASASQLRMSGSAKQAGGSTKNLGVDAKQSAAQIDSLKKSIDAAFAAQMSMDRAAIALRDGMKRMTDEVSHGTRTLNINKDAGRANRSAVLDQISAINDMREARIKHGVTLEKAQKIYNNDIDGLKRTLRQLGFDKKAVDNLVNSYHQLPGKVNTKVGITGDTGVGRRLADLSSMQHYLKAGTPLPIRLRRAFAFASGGKVPGYSPHQRADNIPAMLTAGEFVQPVDSVRHYGPEFMEAVRTKRVPRDLAAQIAAYARGGMVTWPFPVSAKMTRVPSAKEAASVITPPAPPGPSGGRTDDWIVRVVKRAFPGLNWISKFRQGARTLSGNVSYHSRHRAVDWPASKPLAEWWNLHYKKITKEFISPWNSLNIHNGKRHTYTGPVFRQHNFAGGNAHDHIAVATGGLIKATTRLTSLANRLTHVARAGAPVRVFDQGGYWPSGTLGVNTSGHTELVKTRARTGDGGGDVHVHIHNSVIASERQAEDLVVAAYQSAKRKRRIS